MNASKKARFYAQLADAFSAGLSATAALDLVGGNPNFSLICRRVREAVGRGESLAVAFRREPEISVFDVELIAVGEKSGTVDRQFRALEERYENVWRMTLSIASHLAGPPLWYLLVLGLAVMLAIPAKGIGLAIHLLMDLGLAALVLGGFVLPFVYFPYGSRPTLQKSFLRLPFPYGAYVRMKIFYPFVNALRHLFRAGLTIGQALEVAAASTDAEAVKSDLKPVVEQLVNGWSVERSLVLSDLLPEDIQDAIRIGHSVGKLEETLARIEEQYVFRMKEILRQVPFWVSAIALILIMAIIVYYIFVMLAPVLTFYQGI